MDWIPELVRFLLTEHKPFTMFVVFLIAIVALAAAWRRSPGGDSE
jgi:hypothetical protein